MPDRIVTLEEALSASREEIVERYATYVNPGLSRLLSYLSLDRKFVRAGGMGIFDEHGHRFLDFLGGYGSLNLGHNHPEITDAFCRVGELPNIHKTAMGSLVGALAETLAAVSPGQLSRSFFCNSGAEAVEASLKTARAATGRTKILYCRNSFHGKTFGALSVTGKPRYQAPFEPLLPHCHPVPYGDIEALAREVDYGEYAAFIVEPIMGEGGIIVPPEGYLKTAAEICRKNGTLLIADEVQTGLGRTGDFFAVEHEGVEPDIVALAKSLGGGLVPIGACLSRADIWDRAYGSLENCTLHTSTFGGNTRACAVALKSIEVLIRDGYAEKARDLGTYFINELRNIAERHELIEEVRGRGLMIGLKFRCSDGLPDFIGSHIAALIAHDLFEEHRIISAYALSDPTVLRIEPPLIVSKQEIDEFCTALNQVLDMTPARMVARAGWDFVRHHWALMA